MAPIAQKEVFWLSKKADFQGNKAIRGGIPICWPWFGSLLINGENIGNHGFARQNQWRLEQLEVNAEGVLITLLLSGKNVHPYWHYPFQLRQKINFSHYFSQQLIIGNLSDQTINFTAAFHNYFQVSSPESITIDNLLNTEFEDKLNSHSYPKKSAKFIDFSGPVDRIFHCNTSMEIVDKSWQRSIIIDVKNIQQWVLWNPGKQQAKMMSDIHQYGDQDFICLEAACTQAQIISAGAEKTLEQTIRIS